MSAWQAAALTMLVTIVAGLLLMRPLLGLAGMRIIRRRKVTRQPGQPSPRNGTDKNADRDHDQDEQSHPPRSLANLDDLEASDVMTHRLNMRSLNAADPPKTIVSELLNSPFTRMPIWDGALDNIVGVLHAKDVLRALNVAGNDFSKLDIMDIAMKPWFVPDTTPLSDQLAAFLRRKSHFAVVVDEYGEVQGLITLEDIMEEIVGDIADEHDIDVQGVKQEADGSIVVDGSVAIRDLNRALGWSLPDEEATTIAGLVIHEAQTIPVERQAFTFHGKRFVVMKRDKNRITRIRIRDVARQAAVN